MVEIVVDSSFTNVTGKRMAVCTDNFHHQYSESSTSAKFRNQNVAGQKGTYTAVHFWKMITDFSQARPAGVPFKPHEETCIQSFTHFSTTKRQITQTLKQFNRCNNQSRHYLDFVITEKGHDPGNYNETSKFKYKQNSL